MKQLARVLVLAAMMPMGVLMITIGFLANFAWIALLHGWRRAVNF